MINLQDIQVEEAIEERPTVVQDDPFAYNYNARPSSSMSVTEEQKCDRFGGGSLVNSPSPKAAGLGIGSLTKLNQDAIAEEPSLEQIDNTV